MFPCSGPFWEDFNPPKLDHSSFCFCLWPSAWVVDMLLVVTQEVWNLLCDSLTGPLVMSFCPISSYSYWSIANILVDNEWIEAFVRGSVGKVGPHAKVLWLSLTTLRFLSLLFGVGTGYRSCLVVPGATPCFLLGWVYSTTSGASGTGAGD